MGTTLTLKGPWLVIYSGSLDPLGYSLVFVLGPAPTVTVAVPPTHFGSKPMGSDFGVGEFTTHFRAYFSGWIESDVHWDDLDFHPWPFCKELGWRLPTIADV